MAAIFISYRRSDAWAEARALSTDLAQKFGERSVFMDVDNIALGRDFRVVLAELLGSCQVMIVLIGPKWLDACDENGKRRLDDPDDWVRAEVEAALGRDIQVVPVLVDGARIPTVAQLPADISKLAYRNAFELTQPRWRSDVGALASGLELQKPARAGNAAMHSRPPPPQPTLPEPDDRMQGSERAPSPTPPAKAVPAAALPANTANPWAKWVMLGAAGLVLVFLFSQCASQDPPSASVAQPSGQAPTAPAASSGTVQLGALTWTTTRQGSLAWGEAAARCQRLRLDGQTGWRLPNRQELRSIYDAKSPAPGGEKVMRAFHDGLGGNWIWSADKDTGTTALALDFKTGKDVSLPTSFADGAGVLCVRPSP